MPYKIFSVKILTAVTARSSGVPPPWLMYVSSGHQLL